MALTTPEFWAARLANTAGWFDVTKTWTAQQREAETCRLWVEIKQHLGGTHRLVDFGAGLQRMKPHAIAAGLEYLAVDILGMLAGTPDRNAMFHLFDGRTLIPEEIDGDAALFCLVVQHLDDTDARNALNATRAKKLIVIDGAWKNDGYTVSREPPAYDLLARECACTYVTQAVLATPLVRYKVIVGVR